MSKKILLVLGLVIFVFLEALGLCFVVLKDEMPVLIKPKRPFMWGAQRDFKHFSMPIPNQVGRIFGKAIPPEHRFWHQAGESENMKNIRDANQFCFKLLYRLKQLPEYRDDGDIIDFSLPEYAAGHGIEIIPFKSRVNQKKLVAIKWKKKLLGAKCIWECENVGGEDIRIYDDSVENIFLLLFMQHHILPVKNKLKHEKPSSLRIHYPHERCIDLEDRIKKSIGKYRILLFQDMTSPKSIRKWLYFLKTDLQLAILNTHKEFSRSQIYFSLLNVFKDYNQGIYEHNVRVANLVYSITHDYTYFLNALVHDLGKICVPNEILDRPASLTNPEHAFVKKHGRYAREILSAFSPHIGFLLDGTFHHTEFETTHDYDKFSDITKCIEVMDYWDSHIYGKPYREGKIQDRVFKELDEKVKRKIFSKKWVNLLKKHILNRENQTKNNRQNWLCRIKTFC
jgi:hypothetical protein